MIFDDKKMNEYINIRYCVEVDYDIIPSADPDDEYMRESTLENVHIAEININDIVNAFIKWANSRSKIDNYCIDRIVRHFKPWNNDDYDIDVVCGYYGEEIGDVTWEHTTDCKNAIAEMIALECDIEKIEYVLKLEYGFILPQYRAYNHAKVQTINSADIIIGNMQHYNSACNDFYAEHKLPRCVVDEKYRLIDGYHRLVAAYGNNIERIEVILISKE